MLFFKHGVVRYDRRRYIPEDRIDALRKDNEMFYAKNAFYSPEYYNKQLRSYMNEYINFPMRPRIGDPHQWVPHFFSLQCVTNVWQPYKRRKNFY